MALVCTILIYLLPLRAIVDLVRRERSRGRVGAPWTDLEIFVRGVFYLSIALFLEIGFWAVVLMLCGEFSDFGTASYHSAVNYKCLGYGDLIMTRSWRLLGPTETANGTLLFGVSTAIIFAVLLWLIQARFKDLQD